MKKVRIVLAEIFVVLLLAMPQQALASAAGAMALWYTSVAPALFPFLAILPLLTCRESRQAYKALLGWLMGPVFRVSGEMAPAMLIAMLAGSPAGALASARIAGEAGLPLRDLKRCALSFCGLGPVFLVSGVGVAMFGSKRVGILLWLSQCIAQIALAIAARFFFNQDMGTVSPPDEAAEERPVRDAALNVLQVCGYMMLFSIIAGMCSRVYGDRFGKIALRLLDFPAGAASVAGSALPVRARVALAGMLLGWGGMCIGFQNMAVLKKYGVAWKEYIGMRLLASAVCGTAAWMLCSGEIGSADMQCAAMGWQSYGFSLKSAGMIAFPAASIFATSLFLNKARPIKKRVENCKKPQDIAE